MATGEHYVKLPWAAMKPVRDEILPPDVWPEDAPFGELSRLKRDHLDAIFENIISKEHPADGGEPMPFRFRKCIRRGGKELVDALYEGMPRGPADGSGEDPGPEGDLDEAVTPSPVLQKTGGEKGKAPADQDRVRDSEESDEEVAGVLGPGSESDDDDDDDDEDEDAEEGMGPPEIFLPPDEVAPQRQVSGLSADDGESSEIFQGML